MDTDLPLLECVTYLFVVVACCPLPAGCSTAAALYTLYATQARTLGSESAQPTESVLRMISVIVMRFQQLLFLPHDQPILAKRQPPHSFVCAFGVENKYTAEGIPYARPPGGSEAV